MMLLLTMVQLIIGVGNDTDGCIDDTDDGCVDDCGVSDDDTDDGVHDDR